MLFLKSGKGYPEIETSIKFQWFWGYICVCMKWAPLTSHAPTMLELRPSEVFFSQNTIKDHFRWGHRTIYETLKQCTNDPCTVDNIPKITVCKIDGKWFTLDNRRLWVFKQLEAKGIISKISVFESSSIPGCKFTTTNGGTSVDILKWWRPELISYSIDVFLFKFKQDNDNLPLRTIVSMIKTFLEATVLQNIWCVRDEYSDGICMP